MSDSAAGANSYIALVKQTPATPTVIPTSPVMQKVNFVKDDFESSIKTSRSKHIKGNRRTADINIVSKDVGGGYDFEFQYANSLNDELLAAALYAETWDKIGATATVDAESGSCTTAGVLDMTGATEKLTNIVDGQKIKLTGTANSGANDGVYTLTETATDTYSMVPHPSANETFASGVEMAGEMIRDGSFYQPFFIERGHTDVAEYFKLVGMAVDKFTLQLKEDTEVTGSYTFVGLSSTLEQAVESGATYTAATSNQVFSTAVHINSILIDGVAQGSCLIKELDLEVGNNVTAKKGLGSLGACATNAHEIYAKGKITMYFEDDTMYDRLQAGSAFTLDFTLEDSAGNGYSFSLPRTKLDTDKINVSGKNDDVMDDASFEATDQSTLDCLIQIDRYAAP